MAGTLFSFLFRVHTSSLWFVPSPEFVSVATCLSFSPSTDAGLDTRPSVTQRAEGTGLATLTRDDNVHRVAGADHS